MRHPCCPCERNAPSLSLQERGARRGNLYRTMERRACPLCHSDAPSLLSLRAKCARLVIARSAERDAAIPTEQRNAPRVLSVIPMRRPCCPCERNAPALSLRGARNATRQSLPNNGTPRAMSFRAKSRNPQPLYIPLPRRGAAVRRRGGLSVILNAVKNPNRLRSKSPLTGKKHIA
jgi:hypothetical protein